MIKSYIKSNLFTIPGNLPTEIGNLINMQSFDISVNQFSGKLISNISLISYYVSLNKSYIILITLNILIYIYVIYFI